MYYICCKKRNTLFCHIQKNGCESLQYLILKEEDEENPKLIWNANIIRKYLYNHKKIYKLKKKNPNVILISRNPYSRIISGFNDKIFTYNFNNLKYPQKIYRFYNNYITKRINFEEFILSTNEYHSVREFIEKSFFLRANATHNLTNSTRKHNVPVFFIKNVCRLISL